MQLFLTKIGVLFTILTTFCFIASASQESSLTDFFTGQKNVHIFEPFDFLAKSVHVAVENCREEVMKDKSVVAYLATGYKIRELDYRNLKSVSKDGVEALKWTTVVFFEEINNKYGGFASEPEVEINSCGATKSSVVR